MSTIDQRPADTGPEEPTNRPEVTHRIKEWFSRPYVRHVTWLAVIITLLVIPVAWGVIHVMNLSGAPASPTMGEIEKTMFVFTVVSSPLIGVTLAILFYTARKSARVKGEEPPMQDSPAIRTNGVAVVSWIAATSILAAFLVVWGLIELAVITSNAYGSTPANQQPNAVRSIDINVTGQQWVWTFAYPDENNIQSDVLVVPINTPIYFNVTSKDVIHNFWIVELGVKIDVNPGAVTNTGVTPTKLGTYNIRCAELCGLHHAYMETQIRVVTQDEYDAWIRERGGKRLA